MAGAEVELRTRAPRASRRRPNVPPPELERIPPKSGLSRAEVVANQRARVFGGLAAALSYHGYEDTKITDVIELAGISRATFYELFLLQYLLTPFRAAASHPAVEQPAVRG